MKTPTLTTPVIIELWAALTEELLPALEDSDLAGDFIRGIMMSYLDDVLPEFFEGFDKDEELQAKIIERVRGALARIDDAESVFTLELLPDDEETGDA